MTNPYIGPRPFERGDRMFFGRDREVLELVSLIVAHRVVVLYAASGAGKTSLINAGLVPALEEEESFEVLPVARLRPLDIQLVTTSGQCNIYTAAVASNWDRNLRRPADVDLASLSLATMLVSKPRACDTQGLAVPRVVVLDQFEELFTLFPEHWSDRSAFLEEIAVAVGQDPLLRVVLSLREDYLAHLDAYASSLPGELRTRMRIERLGPESALEAITFPIRDTGRSFAPGVAEKLVSDLQTQRVDSALGTVDVMGQFVEPVHLQVACQGLWSELPPSVVTITEDHLRTFGDVDHALSRLYDTAVQDAARAAAIPEGRLRRSIETVFLTSGGTRGTEYRGPSSTGGIPNAAIDRLENRHLVRAEWRSGARWYELTHDRLVEPLITSNRAFALTASQRRSRRVLAVSILLAVLGTAVASALLSRLTQDRPSTRQVADRLALSGYSVVLPRAASIPLRDEPQSIGRGVIRRRTIARDRGVTLVIDSLVGADLSPAKRRSRLVRDYAIDDDKLLYRGVSEGEFQLGSDRLYESRYRYETYSGEEVRNVDVSFERGSRQFTLRASGAAPYRRLAALARQTAASITLQTRPSIPPQPPALEVPSIPVAQTRLKGYSVTLPRDWSVSLRNERQPSPVRVIRRRTVATNPKLGLTLLIDDLTGYRVAPAENRRTLDRRFARDGAKVQYRRVALREYALGQDRAYELRYRYERYDGKELRNVDVIFARDSHQFAVLASGRGRTYDDLARLARRTAQSIVVKP